MVSFSTKKKFQKRIISKLPLLVTNNLKGVFVFDVEKLKSIVLVLKKFEAEKKIERKKKSILGWMLEDEVVNVRFAYYKEYFSKKEKKKKGKKKE